MARPLSVIASFALVVGGGTLALTLTARLDAEQLTRLLFELVVAAGFVGSGLWVLGRGRARWFGFLSLAIGVALFVECWRFSDVPLAYTGGLLFGSLWGPPLLHMVFAFPSGRLRNRFERWLIATAYATTLVAQPLPFLFWEGDFRPVCEGCPRNLAVVTADQGLADALMAGFLVSGLLSFVVILGYFVYRWMRTPLRQRWALRPALVTFAVVTGLMFVAAAAEGLSLFAVAQAFNVAYLGALAVLPFALLTGLLRTRAYRAEAVSGLAERLGGVLGADELRDALAHALEDPTLEVAYWVPEQEHYVDGRGRRVDPAPTPGRAWATIEHAGRPVAAIGHDASLGEEPGLVQSAGAALALALERERLAAALRARMRELRESRARLVRAGDAARRRLERDLHDGAQQRLVSLLLKVKLVHRERDAGMAVLDDVERELAAALAELRALASGILPPGLTDFGLAAAVGELAARFPFDVDVASMPEQRLPADVEVAAYFLIAEALTNVAKHADAACASVAVMCDDGRVTVSVSDDGRGGARPQGGSGLSGLIDRVEALDGRLRVVSPLGAGTIVCAELPCAS